MSIQQVSFVSYTVFYHADTFSKVLKLLLMSLVTFTCSYAILQRETTSVTPCLLSLVTKLFTIGVYFYRKELSVLRTHFF